MPPKTTFFSKCPHDVKLHNRDIRQGLYIPKFSSDSRKLLTTLHPMAEAFKKLFLLHNRHNQMDNHVRLLTCQKSSKIKASKIFF